MRSLTFTRDDGFGLAEVMVALLLLLVGVLGVAGGVAVAARRLTGSQDQLFASQRAAEAAESVFKARDTRTVTWAQIKNRNGAGGNDNGIFVDGPQPMRRFGSDGLANTADDGAVEDIVKPGLDGLLGTADDQHVPLVGFTREIEIRDITQTLRRLRIIVRYRNSQGPAQYVLTTFISSYA